MTCGRVTIVSLAVVAATLVLRAQAPPDFEWNLPKGFPRPAIPADNPMSAAKVDLGRHIFYDLRLSGNGEQSCATCHQQEKAFTDGLATSVGSTGEEHPRNSMSLVNVAYATSLTWANPALTRLEDQALVPMFGRHPVELGLGEDRLAHECRQGHRGVRTHHRIGAIALRPASLRSGRRGGVAFGQTWRSPVPQ